MRRASNDRAAAAEPKHAGIIVTTTSRRRCGVVPSGLLLGIVLFGNTIHVTDGRRHFWQRRKLGQAVRMIQYDRAGNERASVSALQFVVAAGPTTTTTTPLHWFRLDDGVMGGQSETNHRVDETTQCLHFVGTINTNGGGFASIRTKLDGATVLAASNKRGGDTKDDDHHHHKNTDSDSRPGIRGVRLRVRGDGKTYKFLVTDKRRSGSRARRPSWQLDLPTSNHDRDHKDRRWQDMDVLFSQLQPSFGGGPRSQPSEAETQALQFRVEDVQEMGLMLSLQLSDGRPNPTETFGDGIFPFSLVVQSIEPLYEEEEEE